MREWKINLEHRLTRGGQTVGGFTTKFFSPRLDLVQMDIEDIRSAPSSNLGTDTLHTISGVLKADDRLSLCQDGIVYREERYDKDLHCLCKAPVVSWVHLYGIPGPWADFPCSWADWVTYPKNQKSAIAHIITYAPHAQSCVNIAKVLRAKMLGYDLDKEFLAWMEVARLVLTAKKQAWLAEKTCCRKFSGTQVRAMSVRIAEQMVPHWVPDIPKPQYTPVRKDWAPIYPHLPINTALQFEDRLRRLL